MKSLSDAGCATFSLVKRRYPLEALRGLRRKKLEDGALELGARSRDVTRARDAHARARDQRGRVEAEVEHRRLLERRELEAGRLKAADLEQAAAWDAAARSRVHEARDEEKVRSEKLEASLRGEARAREVLEQRHGESGALERHRRAFSEDQERTLERAAEEAAADTFAARRGRS
ncbi:MAG TPA: hypothetical protein VF989_03830 [Polyangiaceae bacterium]|jgi:hypothetical protein